MAKLFDIKAIFKNWGRKIILGIYIDINNFMQASTFLNTCQENKEDKYIYMYEVMWLYNQTYIFLYLRVKYQEHHVL